MERELLILGLLRIHKMHGYQINELIETHFGSGLQLKKATTYHLLNKMKTNGWITYLEEKEGNRPTRRVYSITTLGETTFQKLLRDSLEHYSPVVSPSHIGLAFLHELPAQEAVDLILKRRNVVERLLQNIDLHQEMAGSFHMLMLYQRRHLSAELDWIDEIIDQLHNEELAMTKL